MAYLHVVRTGLLLVAAAWAVGPARLHAQEKVLSQRLLPSKVYVYFSVPSVTELKARWGQTLLGQLAEDPALADFSRDLQTQFDKASNELQNKLGVSLKDLLAVPSGELAVAVLQGADEKLGVVGILDFGRSQETVDKLLEKARTALENQGAERTLHEVGDTQIFLYTKPVAEEGAALRPRPNTLAYFVKDNRLVLSNDVGPLKEVLARWDGQHTNTFAENETFRYIADHTRSDGGQPVFVWFVNPVGLATALVAAVGQDNLQAQMALGFLPVLGLSKFRGIGGAVELAVGDYDTISRMVAAIDFPATGVLKVLEFPAVEQQPPAWVAEDVSTYVGMNWNLSGAYDAVEALVDSFQGPGAFGNIIAALAERPDGPKLHLKKDIIDRLTGRMHFLIDAPDGDEPGRERFLMALGVKDAKAVQGLLDTLADTPDFPGKEREFRGQTLYEIPGPPRPDGNEAPPGGIAVAHEHLIIASDVTLLEQVLRGDGGRRALADSPEFKRIVQHMPGKTSVLGFQRQERQIKAAYDLLRSGQLGANIEGLDFGKLPPFETIEKYLAASGSYAIPDEKGVLFVSFSLKGSK